MTELERKALLGDQEAQKECTEKGIVLPCWRCGGEAEVNELPIGGKPLYAVACKKHYCGAYGAGNRSAAKALEDWNTRPAPPIGRCGECKHSYINFISATQGTALCVLLTNKAQGEQFIMPQDGYCSYFEPKEREENERTKAD